MVRRSAAQTFQHYQVELLGLPMDDKKFVAILDKHSFFSGNQKDTMQAKETNADKASYFLDDVIGKDIDTYFQKLLTVMEGFGGPVATLSSEITESIGLISSFQLGMYMYLSFIYELVLCNHVRKS